MNKTEKLICLVLGAVLAWYIFVENPKKKVSSDNRGGQTLVTNEVTLSQAPSVAKTAETPKAGDAKEVKPSQPEKEYVLENDKLKVVVSSWGAAVKKAVLKDYPRGNAPISDENPAVEFDFSASPLAEVSGIEGFSRGTSFEFKEASSNVIVLASDAMTRKITLADNYLLTFEDEFKEALPCANSLSLGVMEMGLGKNDLLSVDSWQIDPKGGKVIHHCEGDSPLKAYLVGSLGGCGGSKNASGLPRTSTVGYEGSQKWIALKNRFFVTALVSSSDAVSGFSANISRDMKVQEYKPESIGALAKFPSLPKNRTSVFYVGPKKQSLLWSLGMKDVMEFGMWRWVCYPILWLLDFFNSLIPNYGVAIILLTILVRLLFWPLTHKSTVGMKKMQEIQPKMKEIQAKFKDNPQRLQQETWQLYRDAKVNPMSSCLPMLVQIPVFIALFNVLRSAVELRYAPFLWIGDLSEPEGLFSSWFPFGGLNILPILMALTMALQSALTPSTGDKNQQRMMIVFMPVMMLFMFYSFPAALSLYWTLSQVFSIWQMWIIRRKSAAKNEAALMPEVIDPPATRQMRRHK